MTTFWWKTLSNKTSASNNWNNLMHVGCFECHDTRGNNRSYQYQAASTNSVQPDQSNPKRTSQHQHLNTLMAKDSQPFSTMLASVDLSTMQPLCWIPKKYTTEHTTRKLDNILPGNLLLALANEPNWATTLSTYTDYAYARCHPCLPPTQPD